MCFQILCILLRFNNDLLILWLTIGRIGIHESAVCRVIDLAQFVRDLRTCGF